VGPDGFHVPSHSRDSIRCPRRTRPRAGVLSPGTSAAIIGTSLRFPGFIERVVLFNSPLRSRRTRWRACGRGRRRKQATTSAGPRRWQPRGGLSTRRNAGDTSPRSTSRFWAHPGALRQVDFMTEPAPWRSCGFGAYEARRRKARSSQAPWPRRAPHADPPASDHVICGFGLMAAAVFPKHIGPFLLRDCGHFVQWEAAAVLAGAIGSYGKAEPGKKSVNSASDSCPLTCRAPCEPRTRLRESESSANAIRPARSSASGALTLTDGIFIAIRCPRVATSTRA
jgi:hypothetical protein